MAIFDEKSVFRALADTTRRDILRLLRKRDLTPSEMIQNFSISKPSLSHHLEILKHSNLVIVERKGQNLLYSLNMSVFEEVTSFMLNLFEGK
ncbi:MAG: winged helix-turn-helix transcriptional regulator [Okeania sp. SIO1H5]|uniref:autorepressor SdpR family transcription factor n=1 Tax=Okeania sp. SIO1H5 TaxID=2607777 RepID=UPI0013B70BF1|nr:winged helix-turn-helix transcriptional regulator [Okeania sp. SIO1H5]